jgi:hypothetical protein
VSTPPVIVPPITTPPVTTPPIVNPPAPVLALDPASDSGVHGDGCTNVATPTLTGTGATGDTVTLLDGGAPIGSGTVAGDGTWSIVGTTLPDGTHDLTATETNPTGGVSAASPVLPLIIDTTLPPIPSNLTLDPASDSGTKGDNCTNIGTPVITGTAGAGTVVTLSDAGGVIGTTTADPTTGAWSILSTGPLSEGANGLTTTSTNTAGNSSSAGLTVTLDTTPPTVTDALGSNGITVTGAGDPNTAVTISEGGTVVGTAQGDASGAWSFNAAGLAPGAHSLVASETDAAGNTGSAAPLAVAVSDPRFNLVDASTAASVLLHGSDYAGPVDHLQAAYDYTGSNSSVISALVGNVFIGAGAGENAAAAKDGTNVLAGGNGSSWLVGADGSDGGTDTFFLSPQDGQAAWDTLVNFHVGDMLTLWDYNSAAGSVTPVGIAGATGAEGQTMSVDFGQGAGATTLVTFAGLSASAQFSTMTGSTGGHDFSMLTRTA